MLFDEEALRDLEACVRVTGGDVRRGLRCEPPPGFDDGHGRAAAERACFTPSIAASAQDRDHHFSNEPRDVFLAAAVAPRHRKRAYSVHRIFFCIRGISARDMAGNSRFTSPEALLRLALNHHRVQQQQPEPTPRDRGWPAVPELPRENLFLGSSVFAPSTRAPLPPRVL